ncbi:Thiamin pyrophosphokinase, catalytic domain [Roseovarius litorisediminis]|uniref:Thiamine diphosphokinase n=1 Tax=Roseovarius litorisediminis TaxID=1312363 RepID=A0A1Y5RKB8_9RHOB|nr:thiamine diphosphokinase [Roseovarius litorisediminis]SLN19324.1 Thiamin pyrophosphokinase, catalytic domain [Roseovarius litorisediminis]
MIVHELEPITLIGGAAVNKPILLRAQSLAPQVVAADGGADAALAHDVMPLAVIGDFDSLSDSARAKIPADRLHEIPEQESTDFDKCLRNIMAPLVIGVGFSGSRLDHQLAAYNTLVRHPQHRCILLGTEELVFLAPPSLKLDLPKGCEVSLFPFGAVEGVSDGLLWPIAGLNFAPDGRVGTSNHATGPIHLSVTAPKMLVILPQAMLELAVEALLATVAGWTGP